ncbi:Mce protein [Mycobacterium celatum]|uniref:Mce protein n=1 Tax=Mycobacterium celatum TaxID=28045 RepID=A0A2G5PPN2_MYCCE|nr:Mce protein [Mycobacterium celatum]PIB80271.1 Mce protein [Mycobacterium celatum]
MNEVEAPQAGARDEGHSAPRRAHLRWLAAAALAVALAGAGGYAGRLQVERHQTDVAAQQAVAAAVKYAVALTNFDSQAMDRNIAVLRDGATGEFRQRYDKAHGLLRMVLLDHQANAQGQVVESVVKSASTNKVEVQLFVEQLVSNLEAPDSLVDFSSVNMTMEKVDGRWLASKVALR